jgi:putative sigma-54 modulation protein
MVRLRSKSCPPVSPTLGEGWREAEAVRKTGTFPAGGCGVKDQVSWRAVHAPNTNTNPNTKNEQSYEGRSPTGAVLCCFTTTTLPNIQNGELKLPTKENNVQVVIRSRNIEVNERLRQVSTDKITRLVKYLEGMDHAEISFFEERNPRIAKNEVCEVTLSGHGHHVRAKASAIDAFAAVDLVVDKLIHQLTKLKDKLVTKHHQRHHHPKGWETTNKGGVALLEPIEPAPLWTEDPLLAKIVKTKQFKVHPMTADDAALQMDLLQHDFFLFTNEETGRSAVVYRRDDGHLGLIDAAK